MDALFALIFSMMMNSADLNATKSHQQLQDFQKTKTTTFFKRSGGGDDWGDGGKRSGGGDDWGDGG